MVSSVILLVNQQLRQSEFKMNNLTITNYNKQYMNLYYSCSAGLVEPSQKSKSVGAEQLTLRAG
jgi:hypothetical protein